MRNKIFTRSFASYLCLFVMGVSMLSMGYYAFLSRQLRIQYDESYLSSTASLGSQLSDELSRLTSSAVELIGSDWVKQYLYSDNAKLSFDAVDILEVRKQVNELTRMIALCGLLEDVALIFPDKDLVLSANGRERYANYFSSCVRLPQLGTAEELLASSHTWEWTRVPDATLYGQSKDLLACVSTLPLYRGHFYGMLLLLVDEETLMRQVQPAGLLADSDILLLDAEGNVMLGDVDAADLAVVRQMLAAEETLSRSSALEEHEQICISPIDFNDWRCVAMIPSSQTLSVLYRMDRISLAVIIIMLLLGSLGAFLLARRNIRPITQLSALMAEHSQQPAWLSYSDMESSLRGLIDSVELGKEDLARYRPLAMNSLLYGLLTGSVDRAKVDPHLLSSVGLEISDGFLTVLALHADEQQAAPVEQALRALAGKVWACRQAQGITALLVQTPQDVTDSLMAHFAGMDEVKLGASQTQRAETALLEELYAQAMTALQTLQSVQGAGDSPTARLDQQISPPDATNLCRLLACGDEPGAQAELEAFCAQTMPLSHRHYRAYLLASAMLRQSAAEGVTIQRPIEQILLLDSEQAISAFLAEMATEICEQLRRQQEQRKDSLVCEIEQYIDEHLNDSSLSVSAIAAAMGRSDSYISRSYKARTGNNLSSVISCKRVEVAARAIDEGCTISQAAHLAGFDSELTFRRTFRKVMDMNPGDYVKRV